MGGFWGNSSKYTVKLVSVPPGFGIPHFAGRQGETGETDGLGVVAPDPPIFGPLTPAEALRLSLDRDLIRFLTVDASLPPVYRSPLRSRGERGDRGEFDGLPLG